MPNTNPIEKLYHLIRMLELFAVSYYNSINSDNGEGIDDISFIENCQITMRMIESGDLNNTPEINQLLEIFSEMVTYLVSTEVVNACGVIGFLEELAKTNSELLLSMREKSLSMRDQYINSFKE